MRDLEGRRHSKMDKILQAVINKADYSSNSSVVSTIYDTPYKFYPPSGSLVECSKCSMPAFRVVGDFIEIIHLHHF